MIHNPYKKEKTNLIDTDFKTGTNESMMDTKLKMKKKKKLKQKMWVYKYEFTFKEESLFK